MWMVYIWLAKRHFEGMLSSLEKWLIVFCPFSIASLTTDLVTTPGPNPRPPPPLCACVNNSITPIYGAIKALLHPPLDLTLRGESRGQKGPGPTHISIPAHCEDLATLIPDPFYTLKYAPSTQTHNTPTPSRPLFPSSRQKHGNMETWHRESRQCQQLCNGRHAGHSFNQPVGGGGASIVWG